MIVFNDKVKKVYSSPQKRGSRFYTDFYLNNAARTAIAVCAVGGVLCGTNVNKVEDADYESEKLSVTMKEVLEEIPPTANVTGSALVDNRKATIIEYDNVKVYLDNFFGVPLKKEVFDGELIEEHTFSRVSAGVKETDVMV